MIQRSPYLIHMTFTIHFLSLLTWKKEAAGCVVWHSGALPGISFQITSLYHFKFFVSVPAEETASSSVFWHLQAGSLQCTPPTQKKNTRVIWLQTLNYTPWAAKCEVNSAQLTCNLEGTESGGLKENYHITDAVDDYAVFTDSHPGRNVT